MDTGDKYFTWPDAPTSGMLRIRSSEAFWEEVDYDLTHRKEEIKRLGYNPFKG